MFSFSANPHFASVPASQFILNPAQRHQLLFLPDLSCFEKSNEPVAKSNSEISFLWWLSATYDFYCYHMYSCITEMKLDQLQVCVELVYRTIYNTTQGSKVNASSTYTDFIGIWDEFLFERLILDAIPKLGQDVDSHKVGNLKAILQQMSDVHMPNKYFHTNLYNRKNEALAGALTALHRRLVLNEHACTVVTMLSDPSTRRDMRDDWSSPLLRDIFREITALLDVGQDAAFSTLRYDILSRITNLLPSTHLWLQWIKTVATKLVVETNGKTVEGPLDRVTASSAMIKWNMCMGLIIQRLQIEPAKSIEHFQELRMFLDYAMFYHLHENLYSQGDMNLF
ncbi:hypothetical protein DM01DRAFT_348872 [Hesseltinella vesiculosa]|uniref:RFX1-4/6/8-like BCD domain-containing protein n=1 Tax=Hesseltinella vesiculosa TaxID=101127 RepID=A0A1X2GFX6_9FUNG|nr:hypothetical protein DM01DRAFT_348872 [Hesseltinella vesiculosa]